MQRLRRLAAARTAIAAVIISAVVAIPSVAMAVHFTDTGASVHKDNIAWMETTGVTSGCTDTEYCPTNPVTREQMATFMRRLAGQDPNVAPVVNADKLDGLSAEAFLHNTGKAADSDLLDGMDSTAFRTLDGPIELDPQRAGPSITATQGSVVGAGLPDSGLPGFTWVVPVPATYTPGTDLTLTVWVESDSGPCDAATYFNAIKVAEGESFPGPLGGMDGETTTLADSIVTSITKTIPASLGNGDLEPGGAFSLQFVRNGDFPEDTCNGMLRVHRAIVEFTS